MIEIPISTCTVTEEVKPVKKRRKGWFLRRANRDILKDVQKPIEDKSGPISPLSQENVDGSSPCEGENSPSSQQDVVEETNLKPALSALEGNGHAAARKKRKLDLIAVQITAIIVLSVGILFTSVFWKDSGINQAFRAIFASDSLQKDMRVYLAFSPTLPTKGEVTVDGGVMSIDGVGAIYSPCNGRVDSVEAVGDKYTVTVCHSDLYKTVISGVDYVYFNVGDEIFTSSPVCYSLSGGVEVAMYDGNNLISDYTIDSGKVVWEE